MMNNLMASVYGLFFDYITYQDFLLPLNEKSDFGKLGWSILVIPSILLFLFYKVWEPMRAQVLKWVISIVIILILTYTVSSGIVYSNPDIQILIGNYQAGNGNINPTYFIFQLSMVSVLLASIVSIIATLVTKRFSTNNTHNPF